MPRQSYPSLRRHKPSAQGVVTLNGHDYYLGPWPADDRQPPPEVQSRYDRLIAEWLSGSRQPLSGKPAVSVDRGVVVTISEVLSQFWAHATRHYVHPDGTPTSEVDEFRLSLRPVRHLYAELSAVEFGPLKLKAVRQLMIGGYTHPKYGPQQALSRGVINHRVQRIVRVFKWAVSEEILPEAVWSSLTTVRGLQRGRTEARETQRVTPVAVEVVEAVLPFLSPTVAAMVRLQLLTGARPGEVCVLRACDIDMVGEVWTYRPKQHKGSHRDRDRIIAIGPRAQEVIRPFLKLDTQAYLFSPREAVEAKIAARLARRKTYLSCGNRAGTNRKARPKRQPGERYTSNAYRVAITRAVKRADEAARKKASEEAIASGKEPPGADVVFVPHFHPHQIRHSHATLVRREYGLEAAQVALGHSQANVTQIYAERDLDLAKKVAAAIG